MADLLQGIPGQSQSSGASNLPKINLPQAPTTPNISFQGIYDLLSQKQGSMSQDVLPYIAQTLQAPVKSLEESGAQNVAAAQSDAMKRGLTGSDIEAAGMSGARSTTAQQIADAHATISQQLAQYIMQAYGMDIQANTAQFQNLAQAIGEKLASDQSYNMFMQQLAEGRYEADQASSDALTGAIIGAIGSIGSGAAQGYMKR